jgi:Skp family chaperone for outer membrane proteins
VYKRQNQLTAIENRNREALVQLQDQFEQQLNARRDEMINQMLQDIRKAVAAVAQEKKLAVVFDSTQVLYASNDITTDVIKRLNRK